MFNIGKGVGLGGGEDPSTLIFITSEGSIDEGRTDHFKGFESRGTLVNYPFLKPKFLEKI